MTDEKGPDLRVMRDLDWASLTKGVLKAELKRRGLTYADLIESLAKIGILEDERNLRNKISRGSFTAVFLMQCMVSIGVRRIPVVFTGDDD